MDLFQRLLGTLQRTVDYISTFTTYLLGDEAHPGAEEAGGARETVPPRSHTETTRDGGVSPRGVLKASEGPPIAETMPPNQEIQEASGEDFSSAQVTEVILGTSKLSRCTDEGQEDVGREFSESPHFLADDPKPRALTSGSIDERDFEGPLGTGEVRPWGAEGSIRMGPVQQEEMADGKACEPEEPPATGQGQEDLGRAREAGGLWKEEQKEEEGGGQEAPGGAASAGEEQRGLGRGARTRGSPQQVAMTVEDPRSEPDGDLVRGAKPEGTEPGGDEEGGPGEAETRSHPQWEPEEEVSLEAARGAEVARQRGLERSEKEDPQLKALEIFVKEGTGWTEQEENEGASGEECVGLESRGGGSASAERPQQEMARMLEDLRPQPDRQLLGRANLEDHQLEQLEGDGGVQPAVPDRGAREGGPEGDAAARSHSQRVPEEEVIWEVQEGDLEGTPEKRDSRQSGLEVEMEAHPWGELEGVVGHEGAQQREMEENEGDATGGEESGWEEQRGEVPVQTGRPQQEVDKMAGGQWSEVAGPLAGGTEAENNQQGEPDVETEDEGSQQTILDGAEAGGSQSGGQEGEAEAGRSPQPEPGEEVTSEEPPEEGGGQLQWLEGAGETGGHRHTEAESQRAEPGLEREQPKDPEPSAGIALLGEAEGAAVAEKPEAQGQEPPEAEGAERGLPPASLGDEAPVQTGCPAVAGAFPEEVPSLDTSAQKERVLLRRKSSIRRAPSLKRPRPPAETPPLPDTAPEENAPSQPPSSRRPNLRHAGFGPMHPNMMAELQTRLRRPQ